MLMNDDLQLKNKDELIHLIEVTQVKLATREAKLVSQQDQLPHQEKKLITKENQQTLLEEQLLEKESQLNAQLSEKENQATLLQDKATLLQDKVTSLQHTVSLLEEYIRHLNDCRYGKSSEKYVASDLQGRLFNEAELPTNQAEIEAAEEEITIPVNGRKKSGRKGLPKNLPRERIEYDLTDEEKICDCGCQLVCIGEEITEQLDIVPAQIKVLQHVCKKYACQTGCKDNIKTAKKPKQPIPKSVAAPGLLAQVLTSKFQYHLPLYRQEQMLKAIGAEISRNTLSLWVIRCSQLLQPLVNLLQDEILSYDVSYADESTLQVLKEDNKTAESKSYMWVFGGGSPGRFSYLYQYHPSRQHQIAIDFFTDYQGYLHCDGYGAYDAVSKLNKQVIQSGCWYHARRKFTDAAKVSKKVGMADWFIKQIQRLAKVEKVITTEKQSPEQAKATREKHVPAIMNKIKEKLFELQDKAPPQSLLAKAIYYMQSQWPKLQTYLKDGRLEISNNRMERAMKPFAVGRKNWLFANSVDGAHAAANIFSLIETCKAHEVDPYDWLRDTLTKIPACETLEQYEALMPWQFKKSYNGQ